MNLKLKSCLSLMMKIEITLIHFEFTGSNTNLCIAFHTAGIVFGLVNHSMGRVKMNPPPTDVLEKGDEILIIRPTTFKTGSYHPAAHKKAVDEGLFLSCSHAIAALCVYFCRCCLFLPVIGVTAGQI